MKFSKMIAPIFALALVSGASAFAKDGHKHGKNEKHAHKKDQKCESCKKSEKDCKCHEKDAHADGPDHAEEKKESK